MGSIPVINIEHLGNPETLRALDVACREWGFFQVVAHGLQESIAGEVQEQMRTFFAQPLERKRVISRTSENPWGFYDRELTKNTRDWKQIYDYGPADSSTGEAMAPQWPESVPGLKPAILAYYAACETLAFRLLGAISINLGMPVDHLNQHYQSEHSSFVRLNYYPVCPTPVHPEQVATPTNGYLGVNHHTDAGALTILSQDEQPGLEVYRENRWHLVQPVPRALVINIGDIVQVWSNDRYRAALHRVRASATSERYSAPFFFNPAYQTNYAPLPTTIDDTRPARYHSINWGEFRAARAAGDYGDLGEEVQISHYRVA